MVNQATTDARQAERALAIGYAPVDARAALTALFALDAMAGDILRSTRQPIVGQMRLTWWFEALEALDVTPAPAQPVLRSLQDDVLPHGIAGRELAALMDGWEVLLDPEPLDAERMAAHANRRGARLFELARRLLRTNPGDPLAAAGRGWALADLAQHLSRPDEVAAARSKADQALDDAFARRWSRPARALGALALLARADLAGSAPGSPRRAARLLRHRLTGR